MSGNLNVAALGHLVEQRARVLSRVAFAARCDECVVAHDVRRDVDHPCPLMFSCPSSSFGEYNSSRYSNFFGVTFPSPFPVEWGGTSPPRMSKVTSPTCPQATGIVTEVAHKHQVRSPHQSPRPWNVHPSSLRTLGKVTFPAPIGPSKVTLPALPRSRRCQRKVLKHIFVQG